MSIPFQLLAVLFVAALVFAIRIHWILWKTERHSIMGSYWVIMTNQDEQTSMDLSAIWPFSYTVFELWRWDFGRYIVRQDLREEMEEWVLDQKARDNLTWERFNREIEGAVISSVKAAKPDDKTD
jgi:hypothetical protein